MSNGEEEQKGSIWRSLGIALLVIAAIAIPVLAIYRYNEDKDYEEEQAAVDHETEQKYLIVKRYVVNVKPTLSYEDKQDLETVWNYIEDDPAVLNKEYEDHPDEVREAYERIKDNLDYIYGVGEKIETDVKAGDQYTVTGTLEKTDQTTPTGDLYKVEDLDTGAELYFIFDKDGIKMIEEEEMVGQTVAVDITITAVSDTNVEYQVDNGPELVEM